MIVFEKCDRSVANNSCKSEVEITQWLKFRWIVIIKNDKEFSQREFDENSVENSSFVHWFNMTPEYKIDYVM